MGSWVTGSLGEESGFEGAHVVARSLSLLVNGAAMNTPEVDSEAFKEFQGRVTELGLQLTDHLPDEEKLALLREIVHEFEVHRMAAETAQKERVAAWRSLASRLLRELLGSMGLDVNSAEAKPLVVGARTLTTADEIHAFHESLDDYLRPRRVEGSEAAASAVLKAANLTTNNDTATGLRGGGAAVEQLRKELERGSSGYIALIRLSCIEMVYERFGMETVEDCLMAVSSQFTADLHNDDNVYHWSDSSLLSVLTGRACEEHVLAELERIAARNRDITVTVRGRVIMLRIPLIFELAPFSQFKSAEDLHKFSQMNRKKR
jgi:GGDEF domain-containing protein